MLTEAARTMFSLTRCQANMHFCEAQMPLCTNRYKSNLN